MSLSKIFNPKVERYRKSFGAFQSKEGDNYGLFYVPILTHKAPLKVLCAPMDSKWQHVSVSLPNRCPTWSEMCLIKDLFWSPDEVVYQIHPRKSDYVNNHPYCLHLWRNTQEQPELPDSLLVGYKDQGVII